MYDDAALVRKKHLQAMGSMCDSEVDTVMCNMPVMVQGISLVEIHTCDLKCVFLAELWC